MKKKLYGIIQTLLWAGLAVFLTGFLLDNTETLRNIFARENKSSLLLLGTNLLLAWGTRALRDRDILKSLHCRVSGSQIFLLNNKQLLLNYLPLKLGTLHLAIKLKSHYGCAYATFASAFLIQHLLASAFACIFSFFTILLTQDLSSNSIRTLLVFLFLFSLGTTLIVFLRPGFRFFPSFFAERIRRVHDGLRVISRSLSFFFWISLLTLLIYFFGVWRFVLIGDLLGTSLGWPLAIILGTISQVSLFLAITPGALGIRELLVGGGTAMFGFSLADGALVSLVERLATIVLGTVLLLTTWFGKQLYTKAVNRGDS